MFPQTRSLDGIELLTINCWGLKYLSKLRIQRLEEIGRLIAVHEPALDIVGLQECWTQEDYLSIRRQTQHILPFGKFYHSGIFGGGLAILSRWPIISSSMVQYPLNGRPTAFFRGDWFVGKGVACAKVQLGETETDVAEVFCTHLHAPYEKEPDDSYICHRTAQAWEIAKLMRSAIDKGHLVIGLGDFNMLPLSLAHKLITSHGGVKDAWRVLHPDSSLGAAADFIGKDGGQVPTIDFNIVENGTTCDSALNTWRWEKDKQRQIEKGQDVSVSVDSQDSRAKRLDYVFIGVPEPSETGSPRLWNIVNSKIGLTERHPTLKCSLSDHFAVEVTLHRTETRNLPQKEERAAVATGVQSEPRLPGSTYDEILVMIQTYRSRERRQRRLRLGHFGAQILISIGCFIAVWWSPHNFVSFILMLVNFLGIVYGVIDGLMGGLFVSSEMRALKEFEWEISMARRIATGQDLYITDHEG